MPNVLHRRKRKPLHYQLGCLGELSTHRATFACFPTRHYASSWLTRPDSPFFIEKMYSEVVGLRSQVTLCTSVQSGVTTTGVLRMVVIVGLIMSMSVTTKTPTIVTFLVGLTFLQPLQGISLPVTYVYTTMLPLGISPLAASVLQMVNIVILPYRLFSKSPSNIFQVLGFIFQGSLHSFLKRMAIAP